MIRAIIFDMDGVLIEAKDWHYEALNRALGLFGHKMSREEHLATFDGLPTKKKLEILSAQSNLPAKLHPFINEMKQIYTMDIVNNVCRPCFTHEYALSRLKLMGYRLGVASNSIRNSVEVMMRKAHLDVYMDVMFSNDDVARPKPDSEIYEKAIAFFGIRPDECLVVEDSPHGIVAARAAGACVMEVDSVDDVTLENILDHVRVEERKVA